MKVAATVARYLLGGGFIVFGLNAFLQFMPPLELPEEGGQFIALLFGSGYFNYIAILQIVAGLMLVFGRFVPLGLALLGPILLNILLFHISFDPAGIGMGLFFTILWFAVFWAHRASFKGLFEATPA